MGSNDLEHFRSKLYHPKELVPNGQAAHADLATGAWDATWWWHYQPPSTGMEEEVQDAAWLATTPKADFPTSPQEAVSTSSTWQDHQGPHLWPTYLPGALAAVATPGVAVPQAEKRAGPPNYGTSMEHFATAFKAEASRPPAGPPKDAKMKPPVKKNCLKGKASKAEATRPPADLATGGMPKMLAPKRAPQVLL